MCAGILSQEIIYNWWRMRNKKLSEALIFAENEMRWCKKFRRKLIEELINLPECVLSWKV